MGRHSKILLIIAGALAPATIASSGAWAIELPVTTTTTTEAPTTTTTTEATTTTESTTTTTTEVEPELLSEDEPEAQQSQLSGGSLSISAPTSVVLSSGTPVGTARITAVLGTVSVSDTRGAVGGGWTATVSSGDFTTGAGTVNETITKNRISYWSGLATATSGLATFTPGQVAAAQAVSLSSSRTAFTASAAAGDNGVSWTPTVIVDLPSWAVVGTYTGTITHSVV